MIPIDRLINRFVGASEEVDITCVQFP